MIRCKKQIYLGKIGVKVDQIGELTRHIKCAIYIAQRPFTDTCAETLSTMVLWLSLQSAVKSVASVDTGSNGAASVAIQRISLD